MMPAFLAAACFLLLIALSSAASPAPTSQFSSAIFTDSTLLLSPSPSVLSNHTLLLKSASESASAAIYNTPVSIYDIASSSLSSFVSELTFVANTSEGTLALVLLPTLHVPEDLPSARTKLSIEFSTTVPEPDNYGSWYGHVPGRLSTRAYLNNASILPSAVYKHSSWSYDSDSLLSACDQSDPLLVYDLLVAYDSGTKQILVGSRHCPSSVAAANSMIWSFAAADLSDGLFSGSPSYIGLVADADSEYSILNWTFSANAISAIASLEAAAAAAADVTETDDGGDMSSGAGRLRSGAKIGIAIGGVILGAGLVVALVLCACAAARRRRSAAGGVAMKSVPAASAVRRGGGAGGRNAVVIEIQKKPIRFSGPPPPQPPPQQQLEERDTVPLTRNASYTSTGTASWLPPVVPR